MLLTRFSKLPLLLTPRHMDVENGNNAGAIICLTYIRVGKEVIECFKRVDASYELLEVPLRILNVY
jgi:hypothetical protein